VSNSRSIASHGVVKYIRTAVNRVGFDITREPFHFRFVRLLKRQGIDTVLDIGANTGQYAEELRAARFTGRIISVEPLNAPYRELVAASRGDSSWLAVRAAVSSSPGKLTINVSGNSVSSSALAMLPLHSDAVPTSQYVATEEVDATTVDDIVREHSVNPLTSLLKIDVQGLEEQVLDGSSTNLRSFAAVQMELSLAPLYEGQALMSEIVARMDGEGFDLWLTEPAFIDPISGRMYQCDGLFVRRT
jgi:FkbM family methyltransferase